MMKLVVRFVLLLFWGLLIQVSCTIDARITDLSKSTSSIDSSLKAQTTQTYINNTNQHTFSFSGFCKVESADIEISADSITLSPKAKCINNAWSLVLDLSSLTESTHSFVVKMSDLNTSIETAPLIIIKDTVAPSLSLINFSDGTFSKDLTSSSNLTWMAASDDLSGIDFYEISIGTSSGASNISPWINIGNRLSYTVGPLSLANSTTYYANIRAVDKAGNLSSAIYGDGWITDSVAPSNPVFLFDGVLSFSSSISPTFTWTPSSDNFGSGLSHYEFAIGDSLGGSNVLDWISLGNVLTANWNNLTINGSQRYFPSIRAVDNAGNKSSIINGDGWWNLKNSRSAIDVTNYPARYGSYQPWFGYVVAINEDESYLAITANDDNLDFSGNNFLWGAGAVYIYKKDITGEWILDQKITPTGLNARNESDVFGSSVDLSGTTLVVGARRQDYDENGGSMMTDAGAAFVYIRTTSGWTFQQKIVASGTNARIASDQFGRAVAISGDTIAVASSNGYDQNGANFLNGTGAVYVFTRSSGVWIQQQKLIASGPNARLANDGFARSIDIENDSIVVGSPGQGYDAAGGNLVSNAGAVYVFTRLAGVWTQEQKIVATGPGSRAASDGLGGEVKISGNTIAAASKDNDTDAAGANTLLSAGAVFVFKKTTGVWAQEQKIIAQGVNARNASDRFGWCIALNNDTLAVGAINHAYDSTGGNYLGTSGAIFVYNRVASTWNITTKLTAFGTNGRGSGDDYAITVALSGNTIATGAPQHRYDLSGANEKYRAGAAFTYKYTGASWQNNNKIVESVLPGNRMGLLWSGLGSAVAISEDGLTMVATAPMEQFDSNDANYLDGAGAAYVFIKNNGNWVLQQKLTPVGLNARNTGDYLGYAVSISGDTIAIGCSGHDYDESGGNNLSAAGAVFIFTRSGGVWTQQQKIVASGLNNRVANDGFGQSVSLFNDTLAVGAYAQDYDENGANLLSSAGAVYIFERSGTVWTQQQKIVASGLNNRVSLDQFGYSVSLDGNQLAIGARNQSYDSAGATVLANAGAVYIFEKVATTWNQTAKIVATGTNARNASDNFGTSVSLKNNRVAIGSPNHGYDPSGSNFLASSGAVFIYSKAGSSWSLEQKVIPTGTNARQTSELFGSYISLSSNALICGVSSHDFDSDGLNSVSNSGAAFVFTRTDTTWTQTLKLTGLGTNGRLTGDSFGSAVAVVESSPNNSFTFVIGSPYNSYNSSGEAFAENAGALFIFY